MKDNAKSRYDARTAVYVSLKLNRNTDGDLIAALDAAPNKQALIKAALRQHLSSLSDTTRGTMTANTTGEHAMATMKKIASMPLNYADLGDTALSLLGRETYDHLIASKLPEELTWCGDEILGPADWAEELDLAGIIEAAATEMLERYPDDRYWEDV